MKAAIKNKFDFIFQRHFLIPPRELKRARYLEDLGLSKVEQLEMLNHFEDEFKIRVSDQDSRKVRTINDTLTLLEKYLGLTQNQLTIQ